MDVKFGTSWLQKVVKVKRTKKKLFGNELKGVHVELWVLGFYNLPHVFAFTTKHSLMLFGTCSRLSIFVLSIDLGGRSITLSLLSSIFDILNLIPKNLGKLYGFTISNLSGLKLVHHLGQLSVLVYNVILELVKFNLKMTRSRLRAVFAWLLLNIPS